MEKFKTSAELATFLQKQAIVPDWIKERYDNDFIKEACEILQKSKNIYEKEKRNNIE